MEHGGGRGEAGRSAGVRVGLVANPFSARDIRRVVANAASLQIADRANIVLRVLACLGRCGVDEVLAMPERGGIRAHVERGLERARNTGGGRFPALGHLRLPVTGTVEDTHRAVRAMTDEGVAAIVVLGGDGTHRAVAADCGRTPIACVSTGTNNAFPDHREPTVTGLATGLAVTGRVPPRVAYALHKRLLVSVRPAGGGAPAHHPALVDVAVVAERVVGARALWRPESLRELYVTFADPGVIGLSAIAGLLEPVGRRAPHGLKVELGPPEDGPAAVRLDAPIAPGRMRSVEVREWRRLAPGEAHAPRLRAGMIALDGEREVAFGEGDEVRIALEPDAVRTVDVEACMEYAARNGLLRRPAA